MTKFSVLVLFAGLAIVAKIGGLWVDWAAQADGSGLRPAELLRDGGSVGSIQLAAAPAADTDPDSEAAAVPDAEAGDQQSPAAETTEPTEDSENPGSGAVSGDPFSLTDEEIELLQSLAERRRQLETRAMDIDQREILLEAAERRIDEKIVQLNQLQASIEALLQQHDEQEDAQLESLVRIYESMKPKDAARIFEQLDMTVLL